MTTPQARKLSEAERLAYAATCPQACGPQDLSYLGGPIPKRTGPREPLFAGFGHGGSVVPEGWSDADFWRVFG